MSVEPRPAQVGKIVRPRIPVVDGIRAVAMFMVFTCHVGLFAHLPAVHVGLWGRSFDLGRVIWSGAAGVDLFMVLSGFCLFLPLCNNDGSISTKWDWKTFYRRRAVRIIPAYYGAIAFTILFPLTLVTALKVLRLPAHWQKPEPLAVYIHHLLFLQTLIPTTFGRVNAAFWSMGLEVQFYLIFPLLVACCRKNVGWTLVSVVLISFMYLLISDRLTAQLPETTRRLFPIFFLGRWVQFAAGMAAAWLIVQSSAKGWQLGPWTGNIILTLCFLAYVGASWGLPANLAFVLKPAVFAAVFSAALSTLCMSATSVRRLLEHRAVVWLGYISYSIFLLHWPIIYYVSECARKYAHFSDWAVATTLLGIGFPIVVLLSWVSFLYLERPFLGHREKRGQAEKPMPLQISQAAVALGSE